ncbi:hypothetical protein BCO_0900068 (plasmid) [Borrelia coriaceae ATCC 43381]|uniref:Uncharacterized protein n=1 Tax=Borrelia coriaceae ATCC 43381 TaxID=1408429 RepID=W5SWJ5_9SPIR|nr:hypothetical protein BCO_0900068 [Borrelia coriaceae ATCC 43381]
MLITVDSKFPGARDQLKFSIKIIMSFEENRALIRELFSFLISNLFKLKGGKKEARNI